MLFYIYVKITCELLIISLVSKLGLELIYVKITCELLIILVSKLGLDDHCEIISKCSVAPPYYGFIILCILFGHSLNMGMSIFGYGLK